MLSKVINNNRSLGISSVEVLIGVGIFAMILILSTHALVRFISVGLDIADKTQALYLAEEGIELAHFIRDESWSSISNLSDNTDYYFNITGSDISTSTTPELIDSIFTRRFRVYPVERDANDDIVVSGTDDPDSKYVTVTVTWGAPTSTVSLTGIVANIQNP